MIPKGGNRFSEKIMLNQIMLSQKVSDESDSRQLKQTLASPCIFRV
jgi:hypothetical protein